MVMSEQLIKSEAFCEDEETDLGVDELEGNG